ncbi:MAG: hypothetical protein M1824_004182 [Vezdaea acicularis]|nr:MAG: hypothetical protein M1824_004182 [Vezdaea acicularis]
MAARTPLAFVSLILTGGAILLLFFIVLGGTHNSRPINNVYFLRAATDGIKGAPPSSQWTLWNLCTTGDNGLNTDCGKSKPAFPFDPPKNFGTATDLDPFVGRKRYYYLSRFAFAFYLIALFFTVCAFFSGFLALCTRLGGRLSGLWAAIALFFETAAACCMTAWVVMGNSAFKSINRAHKIGVYAMAFTWAAFACLLIATVLFCSSSKGDTTYSSSTKKSRFGRFGRKKSTRSRGSFIDSERNMKDDYS